MSEKIKSSVLSFPVFFEKINDYSIEDDRFTRVKVYLMHTGLNFNNSIFEKDVVEDAIPSLEYIPIVGFIQDKLFEGKDFTEHKYIITKDEKGVRKKYIGHGYGVILSSQDNNAHFEMRTCDDGIKREFLVVDGVIWNMFEDSYEIINRDIVKNHSMELHEPSIDGYEDENGCFHFTKFSFRAACILGNDTEPAMINSTVEVQFTISDFVKNIQSELNDKYVSFTKMVNKNKEGGTETMPSTDFTQTVLQQFEDISNTVRQYAIVKDRWGDAVPRYYAMDIQDNEVIVTDRANNYQYYGFPFTMNGDKAEIDFTKGIRKKLCYTNYEDGVEPPQGGFDFGKHISKIEETAFEKVTTAESKVANAEEKVTTAESNYSTIKKDYDSIKPKYDEYVKAEQKQKEDELKAKKDAMFEKFEKELGENTDFVALKENKAELSVDEIETKCSLLYTRNRMKQEKDNSDKSNFSKAGSAVVGIMDDESGADESTNYIPTKYGNIPIKR